MICADLYELTMAEIYRRHCQGWTATFEVSVRRYPEGYNYFVFAGARHIREVIASMAGYSVRDACRLPALREFQELPGFIDSFEPSDLEVRTFQEGQVFFAHEPVVQVTGPIAYAQLLETAILSIVNHESMVATRASHCATAACGRPVYEMGSRRAHGPEAALWAAWAAWVGGCAATSNVAAAVKFGIPAVGTMAHSVIMALGERRAFEAYAEAFSEVVALVDTSGEPVAGTVVALDALGAKLAGIRLDSGDLARDAGLCRRILPPGASIVATGDMTPDSMRALHAADIDAFGVGTHLVSGGPSLGAVYKLVEVHEPNGTVHCPSKRSDGKRSIPMAKDVVRYYAGGTIVKDRIVPRGKVVPPAGALCLLQAVPVHPVPQAVRALPAVLPVPVACEIA